MKAGDIPGSADGSCIYVYLPESSALFSGSFVCFSYEISLYRLNKERWHCCCESVTVMEHKKTVIVTGFEPFGEHTVNASWVAVQELKKLGLGASVDLHVTEVPVEYQAVQNLLPSLWDRYHPQLVVHVGVSGMATTVTLEKRGHNKGYTRVDNCDFYPKSECCMAGGPECINSAIDMDVICKKVNNSDLRVSISVSKDAGRYLCDYTYYTSLYLGKGRSAFVHVPPLGKPYSAEQLAQALRAVILEMLDLLEHSTEKQLCQHVH